MKTLALITLVLLMNTSIAAGIYFSFHYSAWWGLLLFIIIPLYCRIVRIVF